MKDGKISHSGPKVAQKRCKCPKCGKYYVGYPALLRENNKTEFCSECGMEETMRVFLKSLRK